MSRNSTVEKKLHAAHAAVGDVIRIIRGNEVTEGVLLSHHEFSSNDVVTLKLPNGYNIGIALDKNTKIEKVKKQTVFSKKEKKIPRNSKKPKVTFLGTGGTIACYVDYRTGAVHPATSAQELAFSVPEIFDVCTVDARVVFQLLSENIGMRHWQILAEEVAKALNKGASGVVIPHGTDTLGYTAAALSFMLQDLSGPVVFVGAQRSSDRPSSDAAQNLLSAATVAAHTDIGEVVVVMHGESSDSFCVIHRGSKVRKFHTSQRDAFKTVNTGPLGTIQNKDVRLTQEFRKKSTGPTWADTAMEADVALVYSYPGLQPEQIPEKKGVVLVGTGLGHVSSSLLPRIRTLSKKGTIFVMTSQCFFGRINMNVYSTGRDLLKAGVIPGEDMLPETAYVKLMWALGHAKQYDDITALMHKNLAGETTAGTKWGTSLS